MSKTNRLKDPQKRPPKSWKVENMLYMSMLANAQKTGSQRLVEQVRAFKGRSRHEMAQVSNAISAAVKGWIDAESLDLMELLENKGE